MSEARAVLSKYILHCHPGDEQHGDQRDAVKGTLYWLICHH
jgi:hypothetical protein